MSICLALLLSVPCTLITIVLFCHKKKQSDDSSIDSNSSSSSSSSTPVQQRHIHHHHHHSRIQRSHYAGTFCSPPPPYTTSNQPENVFVTPSLPPPYESHIIENNSRTPISNPQTTVINVEPLETSENQSSTNNPCVETTLNISSTLTSPSIQTFQA